MLIDYIVEDEYIKISYYGCDIILTMCEMPNYNSFFIDKNHHINTDFSKKFIDFFENKNFNILTNNKEFFGRYEDSKFINKLIITDNPYYFYISLPIIDLAKFKMLFPLEMVC